VYLIAIPGGEAGEHGTGYLAVPRSGFDTSSHGWFRVKLGAAEECISTSKIQRHEALPAMVECCRRGRRTHG
jgi:hypothetical protein